MEKILLVGNGLDIRINNNFAKDIMLSKIIKSKTINNEKIKRFIDDNISVVQNLLDGHNQEMNSTILGTIDYMIEDIRLGLFRTKSDASIEEIFMSIGESIEANLLKKIKNTILNDVNNEAIISLLNWIKEIMHDVAWKKLNAFGVFMILSLNEYDLISKHINKINRSDEKMLEILKDIAIEITTAMYEKNILHVLFCKYLESLAIENQDYSDKSDFEALAHKLSSYDCVLTTNYTKIIDNLIELANFGKRTSSVEFIDHLHGKFDGLVPFDDEIMWNERYEKILLGDNKQYEAKDSGIVDSNQDVLVNFKRKFKEDLRNTKNIQFDIFGFSIQNDENLISDILKFLESFNEIENIELNYYAYSNEDRKKFLSFISSKENDKLSFKLYRSAIDFSWVERYN